MVGKPRPYDDFVQDVDARKSDEGKPWDVS
jgi:hypothetical protein